jgi:hypothetical protein
VPHDQRAQQAFIVGCVTSSLSRPYPVFIPVPVSAFAFLRVLRAPPRSPRPSSKNPVVTGKSSPLKLFFTLLLSKIACQAPQTQQNLNNPNPINNIKLSPKWFLVMVNPVK